MTMLNTSRIRQTLAAAALSILAGVVPLPAGAVEVERVVSPGGIEAWLVSNPRIPVISIDFAFEGGLALDPEGKEGLATLVSYTLDEGAGDLDGPEFQRRIADAGIELGFSAGTDAFYGSIKTVTTRAEEAWTLLSLALTSPRFEEDALDRMRDATLAEIRGRVSDPDWLARRVYYGEAMAGHAYGRPSRGTARSLMAIATDDLRQFVEGRFARDRLVVGVSGDITAEALGPVLDRIFGGLPARAAPFEIEDFTVGAQGRTFHVDRDGAQSYVLMARPGILPDDPDWEAAQIANYIFGGGGFESRLTREVREKRGLTYGVSSGLLAWDHAGLIFVASQISNARVAEAIEVIEEEWRRFGEGSIDAEELEGAKTYLTGSFPLQFTSTDRVSGALLSLQLDGRPIDYLDTHDERIEAVTLDDVNRVARRLFDPDLVTVTVVGRPDPAVEADERFDAAVIAAAELDGAPPVEGTGGGSPPPPAGTNEGPATVH